MRRSFRIIIILWKNFSDMRIFIVRIKSFQQRGTNQVLMKKSLKMR